MFSGFKQTVRARFPWLFINLLTATTAASVVSLFTDTIVHLVTLAILMPIVASLGGNAGTQALTVIVRALAMKELNTNNTVRILRKEMVVALLNGVMIAAIGALATLIIFHDLKVSGVFGLAIIINIIMAGTAGAMIPVIMERVKIDPAIASGICLTALTDMTGFFVFLGLASIFLM
jgi:magnesium transporter